MTKPGAQHYALLDAMRGVAALAVLWGHLTDGWGHRDLGSAQSYLAVDFFFILSGFVIGHAYGGRLVQGMNPLAFLRARAIRLYPLVVVGACIGTLVLISLTGYAKQDGLWLVLASGALAAFSLPSVLLRDMSTAFPVNVPGWSLFFELGVNVVYAFVARHLTRIRLILLVALAAVALSAVALQHGEMNLGNGKTEFLGGAVRVLFGFFCGVLLYDLRPRWTISAGWGWLLLAGLALLLFQPIAFWAKASLVVVILIMPSIVWFGSSVREGARLAQACAFLGALSYPLYILQSPIEISTNKLFSAIDPQAHLLALWLALQAAIAIGSAWLALKLFDEPVRAWLSRVTRARPAPVALPQPADGAV